ncbi:MAG: SPOR domain-containing protein [Ignavibacteriales bacterium]|nr:SPOR domain-containing protein [Ignavibacteriales bacterium]
MSRFHLFVISLLLLSGTISHSAPDTFSNDFSAKLENSITVPLEKGFGVVLLSGPNLEDAKKMGKKYSEKGITIRVVKNDKMKKNRYKVVAGLFTKRTDAEFYKKQLQKDLKLKKLWVMEFDSDSKVVNTYQAKNVPKKEKEPEKPVKEVDEEIILPSGQEAETSEDMTDTEKQKEKKTSEEVSSLLNTYNSVLIIYNIGELKALNEYIHPKTGFTVMENSGAFVHLTWYNRIDSLLDHPMMKIPPKSCQPKFESAPIYRCELESWSKTGCYLSKIEPLSKEFIKFLRPDHQDDPLMIEKIKKCETTTGWVLTQSDNVPYYHKYRIYFGLIDGKWYITAIDLTIPCSA